MPLRVRLTAAVVLGFAVVVFVASWFGLQAFESKLREEQEQITVALLTSFQTSGPANPDGLGTFFLDADGNDISQEEFFELIVSAIPDLPEMEDVEEEVADLNPSPTELPGQPVGELDVTGPYEEMGEPFVVDRGEGVIAVANEMFLPDGTAYAIGIQNPLTDIHASVAQLRNVLLIAGPIVVLGAGLATWLALGRAFASMEAIRRRAETISSEDLSQRVPTPESRDEVHALASTVNAMLERLEGAQHQQRRFISDASHELRSPVAAARAQLEVALRSPERTDWPRTGSVVLGEVEVLGSLIDDLFAISRLDEGRPSRPVVTDLRALVEAEGTRHLDVEVVLPERAQAVVEAPLLARAVRNLVDNAVAHSDSQVRVELASTSRGYDIHVDDDGPGIPESERERIFDRFVRLDDARTRSEGGAGLGLAIVRGIVAAHHGQVSVTDSTLGGARFTISLPVSPTEATTVERRTALPAAP